MKKELLIGLLIILFIFIGGYFLIYGLSGSISEQGFGTECNKTKSWIIEEYKIQELKCIGYAGPPFYQYDIYKNGEILERGLNKGSCIIKFKIDSFNFLKFNICDKSVIKLKEPKKQ